jgi:hypothetical protein
MAREVVQPTLDEHGAEMHPAWGLIGASRVSCSPGSTLFDSDIQHQHTIVVKLSLARRRRDLHHDHLMADGKMSSHVVEVEMSFAQWASFVSSMNAGDGVPCTIRRREGEAVPEVPYEPRLAETLNEVRGKAEAAQAAIAEAFAAYKAHKTAGNLRTLESAIRNMPANMEFAAESLSEHAENVTQKMRADVEAFVTDAAQRVGLEPGEVGVVPPELTAGDIDVEEVD